RGTRALASRPRHHRQRGASAKPPEWEDVDNYTPIAGGRSIVGRHGGNHPHLDFAFDLGRKTNLDGVETQFLEHTLQADLIGVQVDVVLLEGGHNVVGADTTVKMAVGSRVGLDSDA